MEAGPPLEGTCGLATLPKVFPWAESAFGPCSAPPRPQSSALNSTTNNAVLITFYNACTVG